MTKGTTTQQAIDLAKSRFAMFHPFDLDPQTWQQLFDAHRPGDVLEAIRRTAATRDKRPEKVFESLIYWVTKFERQRDEAVRPEWPPTDVIPRN